MLPSKLKNFNLFADGESYIGQASEVTLPKIAMAGEEYRGAGMLSEVDYDLGIEKLEMETTFGGMVPGIVRQYGVLQVDGVMLRFVGAYQAPDRATPEAAELVVRGRHMEIDPGSAKAGEDTEWKVSSSLTFLQWRVNGSELVYIDVLNNVMRIGGVDRMAGINAILGN